jgi:hypothetical protein
LLVGQLFREGEELTEAITLIPMKNFSLAVKFAIF